MDGWSCRAQAQRICKSVRFAQPHKTVYRWTAVSGLFIDILWHGSVEHIHPDCISRIVLGKSLSRTNEVYYHAFDLTRSIASIPARPAAIEEAAITFPSLIQVNRVAHLDVRSTLDTMEYIHFENTHPYRS